MSTPTTNLRMPRQARGVHRGHGPSAAATAAGGVAAAGLISDLGQKFDDWTSTFIPDSIGDTVMGWLGSLFG